VLDGDKILLVFPHIQNGMDPLKIKTHNLVGKIEILMLIARLKSRWMDNIKVSAKNDIRMCVYGERERERGKKKCVCVFIRLLGKKFGDQLTSESFSSKALVL
jgi:hypothetical protein